jgi:hypothetical protein
MVKVKLELQPQTFREAVGAQIWLARSAGADLAEITEVYPASRFVWSIRLDEAILAARLDHIMAALYPER